MSKKEKKYQGFIKKLPDLEDTDYFNHTKPWMKKTILNSDKACLKRCEELLAKMRLKGKTKFEDPDFGPKFKGDLAVDSIYDGEIPTGYP